MSDEKRYVLIGTAGHIDHGKTSLVKMLTGCETDTLKEEQDRGLTIDLGFAPCELRGDLMACIVDVPGHERFIRNMVAGASGIDAVLLVVAANDAVMPQTIEHLRIVELLGIERGLVAVTKIDMVDEEIRELVVMEVKDFLRGTFLEDAPICPVSSVTGEGFEGLWTALDAVVASAMDRPVEGVFRMPVERVFSPAGFGTVITGMPTSGRLRVGDKVEALPSGETGRVRGLQVYGKDSELGWAGQCIALNVSGVDHNSLLRGHVLAAPGYLAPHPMAEVRLRLLPGALKPLKHQAPVRLHTGTCEVMGRMFLLDRDLLHPGESALAQFRSEEPIIVAPGDRFVIRQYSPVVTIGGGQILSSGDRKVKRFRDHETAALAAREAALGNEREFVAFLVREAGAKPVRMEEVLGRAFVPRERLVAILDALKEEGRAFAVGTGGLWVSREAVDGVGVRIRAALERWHEEFPLRGGMDATTLRDRVPENPAVVEAASNSLVAAGEAARDGPLLRLFGHEIALSADEEALATRVLTILEAADAAPPELPDLATQAGVTPDRVRTILGYLRDRGDAVRLTDDVWVHADAERRTKEKLVAWLRENEKIGVVDCRDLLGASRKFVYFWLDHFDATGVTYRAGNLRYLKEK